MGFFVFVERVCVGVFDELFFFRWKRSVYGVGVFEIVFRLFVRFFCGKGNKFIFIDEFEVIIEFGVVVKIIGELLKVVYEKGFYVVIVFYLGEDFKKELFFVRVDGIEVKGFDENLNFIVDR